MTPHCTNLSTGISQSFMLTLLPFLILTINSLHLNKPHSPLVYHDPIRHTVTPRTDPLPGDTTQALDLSVKVRLDFVLTDAHLLYVSQVILMLNPGNSP